MQNHPQTAIPRGEIIDKCVEIEQALRGMGANGAGLHPLFTSVKHKLGIENLAPHIGRISALRNLATHKTEAAFWLSEKSAEGFRKSHEICSATIAEARKAHPEARRVPRLERAIRAAEEADEMSQMYEKSCQSARLKSQTVAILGEQILSLAKILLAAFIILPMIVGGKTDYALAGAVASLILGAAGLYIFSRSAK